MRAAAAILGLSSSEKDLKPFQRESDATWHIGMPASSSDADAILVFGGDGTVHRHLAQLVRLQLPVLVVPHGSGNDFARALNLGSVRNSLAAWRKFSSGAGNVRTIDLGVIASLSPPLETEPVAEIEISTAGAEARPHLRTGVAGPRPCSTQGQSESIPVESPSYQEQGLSARGQTFPRPGLGNRKPETRNCTYFCCVGGVGLDAEIARRANQLPRWLRGHGGYALSLPSALLHFTPFQVRISVLDSEQNSATDRIAGPVMLAAFANAPAYGGGIRIAPDARLDDRKLDICVVGKLTKLRLLRLFPSVYFGRHLGIRQVEYLQTEHVRVETDQPMDVYADGEYVCRTPVEVSIEPAALKVIVPASRSGH